jgi:hypothetical protein
MSDMRLPEFVRMCGACDGTGEYEQMYTSGCGGGYYLSKGNCEFCGRHSRYGDRGPGYVYIATGEPVGESVLALIRAMNGDVAVNT